MSEKAKRLKPQIGVLRELYLKSGNQCAFPGCHKEMINENGDFIGQICHIEAADEGGERFNVNMSNEDRRSFNNLMLMCYEHHIITNNIDNYSVAVLKQIKKSHEEKYSGIINKMFNSIVDYGKATSFTELNVCQALSDTLEYGCSRDENIYNSQILNKLLKALLDVPIETRAFLGIMVNRSDTNNYGDSVVPLHEVELATGKDPSYLLQQIDILKRRHLISEPDSEEYGCYFCLLYGDRESGWDYWNDIKEFCTRTNISLEKILTDLDFSLFD
ncbi:hypothetical protein [Acetobacterium carbinolicum]|uniref:hypothetical protein n=1 Tax=Acetobacterium carbinolicum TaxID=52690 RepID=UPI003BF5C179